MRSLISKLRLEKLSAAFGGMSPELETKPGRLSTAESKEAIALAEAMICDAITYSAGGSHSAPDNGNGDLSTVNVFGKQVLKVATNSVSGAVAASAAISLTGLRSSAFLSGDQLSEAHAQLKSLANRQLPLVLHATFREGSSLGSSHMGYHDISDLGLFQILPHSVQQAVDFVFLARWLTERALIPGLVGIDRHTVEQLSFPSMETVREFMGFPSESLSSPTPAQLLLFGAERPLVPKWFDLDRPVSFASLQGLNDGASGIVGRQSFFWDHLSELAKEGMRELSQLTGRTLSFVSPYQLEDADSVVVVQGTAFQTAKAAADYIRMNRKGRVGVLGVTWLRPFPAESIKKALSGKRRLLVLECAKSPFAQTNPLMREVRECAGENGQQWMSASYGLHGQPLHIGQLLQLISELEGKNPRRHAWLGITSGQLKGGDFPKREGLVKAVATDYPDLTESAIATPEPIKTSGTSLNTVQWIGSTGRKISEVLSELAETVADASGPVVRGYGWYPEPGVLAARVAAGDSEFSAPEIGTTVDILLLERLGLDLIYNPLADLSAGGSVVIDTDRSPQEIWELMPDFWRSEIRRLNLRLFKFEGELPNLIQAASLLLKQEQDMTVSQIDWTAFDEPQLDSHEVPRLIRRVKETGSNYDNLPRFWGEIMQPKRGGISDNFPDPLVTVGAVPPYTAALARPRATALPNLPVLDTSKCTGCGDCWPVCPDSAIGVTLLKTEQLLDAAAGINNIEGKAAGAVKRAHKQIAGRAIGSIIKQEKTGLDAELLIESYQGIADKLRIPEEERTEHDSIFAETAKTATRLTPVLTERFLLKPEQQQKGSGNLLMLAVNPDACQGCQLCIHSCPESALTAQPRAGEAGPAARDGWKLWEELPDTSGDLISETAEDRSLTAMAALLLSRHCSQIQAVGSFGEPGSGERLATRLVTAVVEAQVQKHLFVQAEEARGLAETLRNLVHSQLAEGLTETDSKTVETALKSLPKHRTSLGELSDRLASLGTSVSVDTVKTLRLAQTVRELENDNWLISEGVHGLGRSRFGVVIVSNRVARWAGRFPNHPYHAPMVVDPSSDGFQLVYGLATATTLKHLSRVQLIRRARLWKESPPDLPGQLVALEDVKWQDLTLEEKQQCPPLLVFADESALTRQSLGELSNLLTSDLPVKIVLLDSCDVREDRVEPALIAIAHQNSFVLSGSLAYSEHLVSGLNQTLAYPGPALVHLHAPVPKEHGFDPSQTVERARSAVESRVHPLFSYDPSSEGVFGVRTSLEGNPRVDESAHVNSICEWVLGEARFKSSFRKSSDESDLTGIEDYLNLTPSDRLGKTPTFEDPASGDTLLVGESLVRAAERRQQMWNVYREIAGQDSPFVERIRQDLSQQVEDQQRNNVEKMKKEFELQIAEIQRDINGKLASQLRDRLLALSGFGSKPPVSGNE